MNPVTFDVTFIASVLHEYANFGINGYMIGTTKFRSMASLESGLDTAFSKDLGPYRALEVQIVYRANGEQHQAVCTADNYQNVLNAIESTLSEEKQTLDTLLEE